MALTREEFLKKRVSPNLIEHKFSDSPGDSILMRPISAKLYRDYRRSLRDKDGAPIPERQAFGDELLVGRVLVEADGSLMFSDEDVMGGIFDDLQMFPLASVVAETYKMLGIVETDEDREKNLSATVSTGPS